MSTIEFTDRSAAARTAPATGRWPRPCCERSGFRPVPWSIVFPRPIVAWRIGAQSAVLRRDRHYAALGEPAASGESSASDESAPSASQPPPASRARLRLLMIGSGVALHQARLAMAGAGAEIDVDRCPTRRLRPAGPHSVVSLGTPRRTPFVGCRPWRCGQPRAVRAVAAGGSPATASADGSPAAGAGGMRAAAIVLRRLRRAAEEQEPTSVLTAAELATLTAGFAGAAGVLIFTDQDTRAGWLTVVRPCPRTGGGEHGTPGRGADRRGQHAAVRPSSDE